jgi:hypothetical protein
MVVRPVGGQALQAGRQASRYRPWKLGVRVVGRHVDGLGDGGVDEGLHRFHHGQVVRGRHLQRRHEIGRQGSRRRPAPVQPPGMVLHVVLGGAAVAFALLAAVGPREGRLDAVGRVVGERQAHGAGGRDRQQVAVADAVPADGLLQGSSRRLAKVPSLPSSRRRRTPGTRLSRAPVHRRGVGGVAHSRAMRAAISRPPARRSAASASPARCPAR